MTERYGGGTESDKNLFCRVTGLMYNNSDNTFFLLYIFRPITNFCLIKRDWFSKSVLSYLKETGFQRACCRTCANYRQIWISNNLRPPLIRRAFTI